MDAERMLNVFPAARWTAARDLPGQLSFDVEGDLIEVALALLCRYCSLRPGEESDALEKRALAVIGQAHKVWFELKRK